MNLYITHVMIVGRGEGGGGGGTTQLSMKMIKVSLLQTTFCLFPIKVLLDKICFINNYLKRVIFSSLSHNITLPISFSHAAHADQVKRDFLQSASNSDNCLFPRQSEINCTT